MIGSYTGVKIDRLIPNLKKRSIQGRLMQSSFNSPKCQVLSVLKVAEVLIQFRAE